MTPGIWLGLDPSLSHFGFAVAQVSPLPWQDVHFVETGVWATKPDRDDRTATAGYARRLEYLTRNLWGLVDRYGRPVVLACEGLALPFGKTSLQTVSALGRVRGLVDALAASQRLTVREYQPAHLKRLVTGAKDATKDDVRRVVEAKHPELKSLWPKKASDVEHAADAASAIYASLTKGN